MRNLPLKGMLNAASPIKQRVVDAPELRVKPGEKVVEKKVTPPPRGGFTTYVPGKGGEEIAIKDPH